MANSVNADKYGISYGWGGVDDAYRPYGSIGHPGVDIAVNYQEVFAEWSGTIQGCYWGDGYGNHIVMIDIDGDKWIYAHLDSFNVSPGQYVRRGDVIGISGATGFVTGPHCHIEVFPTWGGNPDYYGTVDPIWYLSQGDEPSDTAKPEPATVTIPKAEYDDLVWWKAHAVNDLQPALAAAQDALKNELAKPPKEIVKTITEIVEKIVQVPVEVPVVTTVIEYRDREVVKEVVVEVTKEVNPSWLTKVIDFINKVLKKESK